MKNLLICFGLTTTFVFSSATNDRIDQMVDEIKQPRKGIALNELATTPDPFVVIVRDAAAVTVATPQKKEENLILSGIINDKAFINGAWYKVGDEVIGYTLHYIGTKGVVLVDAERVKKLFLHEKIKGIITIKEGEE